MSPFILWAPMGILSVATLVQIGIIVRDVKENRELWPGGLFCILVLAATMIGCWGLALGGEG